MIPYQVSSEIHGGFFYSGITLSLRFFYEVSNLTSLFEIRNSFNLALFGRTFFTPYTPIRSLLYDNENENKFFGKTKP